MCLSVCKLKYISIRQQTHNLYHKKSKSITAHIFDKFFKTFTSTTDKQMVCIVALRLFKYFIVL